MTRGLTMLLAAAAVASLLAGAVVYAQSNIDPITRKYAWSENGGHTNWRDAGIPAGNQGVNVGGYFLSGFIWGENLGYINVGSGAGPYLNDPLDASTFGINIDSIGFLHGMAWGENIGWVNFDGGAVAVPPQPARIDCLGFFHGFVWGENVGWINLRAGGPPRFMRLTITAVPVLCDLNHDLQVNGLDIQWFVNYLLFGGAGWNDICSGDLEPGPDGIIDFDDVDPFVTCLLS